LLSNLANM